MVDPRYVSLNHELEDLVWPKHPPKGAADDQKDGAAPEQGADQVPGPPADQGTGGAPDQVPVPPADQGSDRAPDEEDTDKAIPVSLPPPGRMYLQIISSHISTKEKKGH